MINTRSTKRYKVKTPGGRTVFHTKWKKHDAHLLMFVWPGVYDRTE